MTISGVSGGIDFAAMRQMQQQMMAKIDVDGSGSLNLEEFSELKETIDARRPAGVGAKGSAEEVFAQIDTNSDGQASTEELMAFKKSQMPSQMLGSMSMKSLLMAQEQSSGDRLTSLLDTLESDEEGDESDAVSEGDSDATNSYFEKLQAII
ncbi:MAG: EF-hand domain-containing protein [Alphaproteobacteria bacterium]|nr:EF-hand domain-containing protein [Alphaproteobacteria bacterium]